MPRHVLPPPPLLVWLLWLLLSLVSGQLPTPVHYYCDTPGRDYITRHTDFYLHTRQNGSDRYLPGSRCAFYAISQTPGAVYFVQLLNASMPSANLTIRSDPDELLRVDRGATPKDYAMALTTPRSTVTVSFFADQDADTVVGIGAVLRVRLFTDCPPDWRPIGDYCFGNAGNGLALSFADSQAACRSMRANLLHLPPNLPGIATVTDLYRELPNSLMANNWIGLTDYTSNGQFHYYWLDGTKFSEHSLIGCQSSKLGNNLNCKLEERCSFFISHILYLFRFIVMDSCSSKRNYACFMPTGGATVFYSVPTFSIFSAGAWAWAIVIGCLFAIGVGIGVVYAVLRLCNSMRSSASTTV